MQLKSKALLITAISSLGVLSPLLHGNDSFPLSNYPMFSGDVQDASQFQLAVGLDSSGERIALSPRIIAETDEVIQAGSYVRSEIRNGRAERLCASVLARTTGSDDIVSILVVTDIINSVGWYQGETDPSQTVIHAACGEQG